MKRILIVLGTLYLLWKIVDELLEDITDQRFWQQEYENNPEIREAIRQSLAGQGISWEELKKQLNWTIDDQFNELHATPGYWDHVKEQHD